MALMLKLGAGITACGPANREKRGIGAVGFALDR